MTGEQLATVLGAVGLLVTVLQAYAPVTTINEQRALATKGLGPLNPYFAILGLSSDTLWLVYVVCVCVCICVCACVRQRSND